MLFLVAFALTICLVAVVLLIFDVVIGLVAGIVAAVLALAFFLMFWVVLPSHRGTPPNRWGDLGPSRSDPHPSVVRPAVRRSQVVVAASG